MVQRLGELGWVEGRNVVVEYRYAEGSLDPAGEAAAEFARMRVAKALGLTIPETFLTRADVVIE